MKLSFRYRLFFLALVVLLGLGLLNPALLFTYLIDPITRIVWLAIRMVLMIDQGVFWALLIFAVFMFVLRVIPSRPESPLRPGYSDPSQIEDRVARWEALLHSAEERPEARLALQQELTNLNRSVQALAEGDERNIVDLPPIKTHTRHPFLAMGKRFFRSRYPGSPVGQVETDLEKKVSFILKSLETKLEIKND